MSKAIFTTTKNHAHWLIDRLDMAALKIVPHQHDKAPLDAIAVEANYITIIKFMSWADLDSRCISIEIIL